ncbi:hypothetical protein Gotri_025569 [Gossypium trilobum]|uniref:Uncharacterized protein n=1 Tax=Gossypium trilobum TaxID=34281 RepID=A0A7J9FXP4_9ROSI|nr:hypothetical protein [Gossypium trilobum]
MEDTMANMRLLDDEEEAIQEVEGAMSADYQFCLVGLMSVSMAKQFGDFCGHFFEYDTSIPTLGIQSYLRIRVCLDVTAPLKRKKKVLVGKIMVVYARFKYDKLTDGTQGNAENFAGVNQDFSINEGKTLRRKPRGVEVNQNINPNMIPLGYGQYCNSSRPSKGRNGGNGMRDAEGSVYGAMELVSNEEEDPIALMEGKKRQRVVESLRVPLDAVIGPGCMDVSASSSDQSSREQ